MARLLLSSLALPLRTRTSTLDQPRGSILFDAAIVALSAWFTIGLYLDGWAHQHIGNLETFFTPWHAVLYSGFFASASLLALTYFYNLLHGYPIPRALPVGYELSMLGVIIFMIGGVADLIWHILFGIEANVEALLSPTHLVLACGGALILTGPLRAAWRRAEARNDWHSLAPMIFAMTFLFSLFTFFTQYANPFGSTYAAESYRPSAASTIDFYNQALGIIGILLYSALLLGLMLFMLRRWNLPFGALTLMLVVNTALMVFMRDKAYSPHAVATGPLPLIGVAFVAGLIADALVRSLKPMAARPFNFRLFAFAVPTILFALYFFALLIFGGGIWWTIHLWTGAIPMAGIVGFLLSYAFVPPAFPMEEGARS